MNLGLGCQAWTLSPNLDPIVEFLSYYKIQGKHVHVIAIHMVNFLELCLISEYLFT